VPKTESLVGLAVAFARRAHESQQRLSGEPYYAHVAAAGEMVASLGMDARTVAAAYLHDVLEETDVKPAQLARLFGAETLKLVEAVTNLSRLDFASEREYERANLGRMFLAMAGDVRVVIIKIADRLDNLRSLEHLPPARRRRYAREALHLFAPLADRLGLGQFRWELEDFSFRHLEPERYRELATAVAGRRAAREKRIAEISGAVEALLAGAGLDARVEGRPKNLYSIYRKMVRDGRAFDEIYDLLGIRVIVPTVADCYRALDALHGRYTPIPGRYKDFITRPKANFYQSLHTTVHFGGDEMVEVQVRTSAMDAVAAFGVAAHWRYKKESKRRDWGDYPALKLMRAELGRLGGQVGAEPLAGLMADLAKEDVFVFTPQGDLKRLPHGATPVDFAYAVHTAVGHRCAGAKVNGRLAPLRTVLETGDVVEIQTSPRQSPSRDWLEFVVSSSARHKIRAHFRGKDRLELATLGRAALGREAQRRGLAGGAVLADRVLAGVARDRGLGSAEELLTRVGEGALAPAAVVNAVEGPPAPPPLFPDGLPDYGAYVSVAGVSQIEIRMAGCCKPIPMAPLAGYVTSRGAVSVHRRDCPTLRRIGAAARTVAATWRLPEDVSCGGVVELALADEGRGLPEVVRAVQRAGLRLAGVTTEKRTRGAVACTLHLRLATADRLKRAVAELRALDQVSSVSSRIFHV